MLSGCGKTILLRIIARLGKPKSGQIIFYGKRHVNIRCLRS
ncbi:MAG: ATP-binding cassette domain-containing protein [Candidatus Malihini olakiniferum]